MTPLAVRLLVNVCSACGGKVVSDNTGSGRPPQHIQGPDDHEIKFGSLWRPEPPMATLDDLAEALSEEPFPPPGVARPMSDDDLGGPRSSPRMMVKKARAGGFDLVGSYCQGPWRTHGGRSWKMVGSLAVTMSHADGRRAVGMWHDRAWKRGLLPGQLFASASDVSRYLQQPDSANLARAGDSV